MPRARQVSSPARTSSPGAARASGSELGLEVLRELGDRREVEELSEVDLAGIEPVDLLVDLDELERARADLEEIVVHIDPLALESCVADGLQLLLELAALAMRGAPLRRAQRRELGEVCVELAVDVALLEQMSLDLAARGLRDALDGNDFRDLEPGLLVDEPRDLRSERQEIRGPAPVQHEHHELLGLGAAPPHARGDHLAELQSRRALRDGLEVVRVVVLAV